MSASQPTPFPVDPPEGSPDDLGREDRKQLADGLATVMADTFALYFKTHGFHWNVVGERFRTLHLLFEEQYQAHWEAVDDIAERIRGLGEPAPSSFRQVVSLTSVSDEDGTPLWSEMVRQLAADNRLCVRTMKKAYVDIDRLHDQASDDLLSGLMRRHDKFAWELEAMLA